MTAKPGTTSTADRILDAAIGLMNTKGYNPVSVREIAKAVGLSEMTVFRHFPSKYAMLMAAMRRAPYAEMIEDVFTTHVRWELEHDLRHFMRRYMDIAEQDRHLADLFQRHRADRRAQHGAGQRRHLVP